MQNSIKPLSEAISIPIIKAYRVGGFGLVFIFIGTLLLLTAFLFNTNFVSYLSAGVGTLLILVVLLFFYFQSIRPLMQFSQTIQLNRATIDAVQTTAIQLTELISDLQSLAFKHAEEIASIISQLKEALQTINNIPGIAFIPGAENIKLLGESDYVLKTDELATSIIKLTKSAKNTIEEIKTALIQSNPELLAKYLSQLKDLDARIVLLLAQ